ncbi:MAG: hypothetical protein GX025_07565, partial [Clostridiales bacterium]|nr:hypothetical protein [Clostridiales bacterium]
MEFEKKINQVLTSFYKVTQIEALYFDKQMNITSCKLKLHTYEDFCRLGIGEIEAFLKKIFAEGVTSDSYIYYLRNNFICNISILNIEGNCGGAIVTQPIVLNTFKKDELKLKCDILPLEERDAYIRAMLRAPMVSHDRIKPIGTTLDLLVKHSFGASNFNPIICGGETDPLYYQLTQPESTFDRQSSPSYLQKFDNYSTYSKIKDAITKGDSEVLLEVFDSINMEDISMDQHASKNIIRSIKNRLIESCAMCGFFAIEAQAPYVKTRNYIKHIIREIENTDNVNDMYNLVRTALKTL